MKLVTKIISIITMFSFMTLFVQAKTFKNPATDSPPMLPQPIPIVEQIETPEQTEAYIRSEWAKRGIQGNLERFIRIGKCESQLWEDVDHYNPPSIDCPNGSLDRGVYQINDCYHPQIGDECAYDAKCNVDYALTLYERSGEQPWVCKDLI